MGESWKRVKEALDYAKKKPISVKIDGFPDCYTQKYKKNKDNLQTNKIGWISEIDEINFFKSDEGEKTKAIPCIECGLKGCQGYFKAYIEKFGYKELKPTYNKIGNSFNFLEKRDDKKHKIEISLYENDRETPYYTDTEDFSEKELASILHKEQIYLNTSSRVHSENFEKDYRKLNKNKKGCFELSQEDVFKKSESEIEKIIDKMQGSIIDVGCNDIKYPEVFRKKRKKEDFEYLGIDIDEEVIKSNKTKFDSDKMSFVCEDFMTFLPKKKYNNILSIRSINHIKSIRGFLAKCYETLKSEGEMLICENCPFGVIQKTEIKDHRGEE
jgi:2-polyprenyl-3-methyl-5-hydroxy-6-metoxy-1,4-benzoquinol methylase